MGPTLEGHDMTGIKYKVVLEPFIYFKLFTQKKTNVNNAFLFILYQTRTTTIKTNQSELIWQTHLPLFKNMLS